jgi:hypothetical protein
VDNIAQLSRSDRADLFDESAARMGLHTVIIEKDFWVFHDRGNAKDKPIL